MSAFRSFALCALIFSAGLAHADTADTLARIARVENGLRDPVAVQGVPQPTKRLAERMRELNVPGVSIALIDQGKLAWTYAFGSAEAGKPVTPNTLFQAASISKLVSALGMLTLIDQGKLALDAGLDGKLAGWTLPENDFTRKQPVTLRALLSHTAGTTVSGFRGYAAGETVPDLAQVLDGLPPANSPPVRVVALPGSKWNYSGGGYTVAQMLASGAAGAPYADFMQRAVLAPLGMARSTFAQPLPQALRADAASGHTQAGAPLAGGWHTYPELAAAGLWTTPSDLARVVIAMQQAAAGKQGALISPGSAAAMLTPVLNDYGLGTMLTRTGATQRFAHGGSNAGFRAMLVGYTQTGQGVAIMTNGDNGLALIDEILRAVAAEYDWRDYRVVERKLGTADPAGLAQLAGTYAAPGVPASTLAVSAADGKLWVAAPALGPKKLELLPEEGGRWFVREQDLTLAFVRGADGAVRSAEVVARQGRPRTLERTL